MLMSGTVVACELHHIDNQNRVLDPSMMALVQDSKQTRVLIFSRP